MDSRRDVEGLWQSGSILFGRGVRNCKGLLGCPFPRFIVQESCGRPFGFYVPARA